MKWTSGINYHPTSLEFVVDGNRDYRAELPPHLAELGLPKAVAYIRRGKPVTNFELDNGRVADGRTLRQYIADETAKEFKRQNDNNN